MITSAPIIKPIPFWKRLRRNFNPILRFFIPLPKLQTAIISARTLNNHFFKNYGKTFYAYQMETKLEMVRDFLIHQPDAKLHEAALNFGFYDEFHLSKAFKKQYGVSPSKFRASF